MVLEKMPETMQRVKRNRDLHNNEYMILMRGKSPVNHVSCGCGESRAARIAFPPGARNDSARDIYTLRRQAVLILGAGAEFIAGRCLVPSALCLIYSPMKRL